MFDFLKKFVKKDDPDSVAFRRSMAKKLNGRAIKYVTERKNDADLVVGRAGALIIKDDEFIVFSSSDIVFRAVIDEMHASELMSLEGAILTAPDIEHGGEMRTIIAYYTYYLK